MKIKIQDRCAYTLTAREYTDEGFLKVPARVARIGIQEYVAQELDLPGDPNRIVRVMRPADEVFNPTSLDSYAGSDVTNDHPSELVNSETFRNVTCGVVLGPGRRDGDFVIADLIVKDKAAIQAIESGKCECSVGYTAIYDDNVPEGADYEFLQRDIVANHVALVDRARAGRQAKLFDNEVKTMKITLDGGKSVELPDGAAATLVADSIERMTNALKEMNENLERSKASIDHLKSENEKLKANTSDSVVRERLKAVGDAVAKAKKIAGKSFTSDSLDIYEIYRQALKVKDSSIDWKDKSDIYIEAAMDIYDNEEEEEEEEEYMDEDMEKEENGKTTDSQYRRLANDGARAQPRLYKGEKRLKYIDGLSSAWMKKEKN